MSTPADSCPPVGLPADALERIFPFCLIWNRDLRVERVGPSMAKICPAVRPAELLLEHFRMSRPHGEPSWSFFEARPNMLFLFENVESGQTFRGQLVVLGDRALFLCSPWFSSAGALEESDLTLNDFALHDQTTDLLQVVQAQQMANHDLQRLAEKLVEKGKLLREKEAESRKLALVAARTDNSVIITDATGRIEWVNEGFHVLSGWTLQDVQGKKPGEFLQGPLTDGATIEFMSNELEAGRGFNAKLINYHRNGSSYWIELEVQPICDEKGELQNFIGLQRDITKPELEKKRRALQLSVSLTLSRGDTLEATLKEVLGQVCRHCGWEAGFLWATGEAEGEATLPGAWHQDDEKFESLEREFRNRQGVFGAEWQALMSGSASSAWTSVVSGRLSESRQSLLREAGLKQAICVPIRGDQREHGVLEFFCSDGGGEVGGDVQEMLEAVGAQLGQFLVRKQTEEALRRSKAEAEAASKAKSEFLATMSHEIRTPMNGVLGFAQILQEFDLSQQQKSYVSSIYDSAGSLLHVINDILDFSKIESGNLDLERREFDLIGCVESAIQTVSASAEDKGIELVARYHPGVPAVIHCDEHRLRQVLVNLLSNALKFTESGSVCIDLEVSGKEGFSDTLLVKVSDTGIGIEPEMLPKLFSSFRQADSTTTRRFGGSGLGLAICKKIIDLMGGALWVESKPAQGSVFSFTIKCGGDGRGEDAIRRLARPDLEGRRVLLVDGQALSVDALAAVLHCWRTDLLVVRNPADGLKAITKRNPDVILLDGGFPFAEISDLVRHAQDATSELYLMVRRKDEKAVRDAFATKLAGVLAKPVRISELRDAVCGGADQSESHSAAKNEETASENTKMQGTMPSRVLLVEDNHVNQKYVLAALNHMGLSVDVAESGLEALAAVEKARYDVILMDVHMPEMDGLTATRRIREREAELGLMPTKIIGVTADAILGSEETCLSAGMDMYLSKPVNLNALRTAMSGTVSSPGSAGPDSSGGRSVGRGQSLQVMLENMAEELSLEEILSVAGDFCDDLPVQCGDIQMSIRNQDLSTARRRAHSLKGGASIFRLHELVDLVGRIEELSRDGDLQGAEEVVGALGEVARRGTGELQEALTVFKRLQEGKVSR